MAIKKILEIFFVIIFLVSCSSNYKRVRLTTTPAGASVLADGKTQGDTPCTVKVTKTGLDHYIFITKNGYRKVRKILREEDSDVLHVVLDRNSLIDKAK